jgi:hypothetical protein
MRKETVLAGIPIPEPGLRFKTAHSEAFPDSMRQVRISCAKILSYTPINKELLPRQVVPILIPSRVGKPDVIHMAKVGTRNLNKFLGDKRVIDAADKRIAWAILILNFKPQSERITLKKVADEAGCHVNSVVNVLHHREKATPELQKVVLNAAKKLAYKSNRK